jgi:hypothetical protein
MGGRRLGALIAALVAAACLLLWLALPGSSTTAIAPPAPLSPSPPTPVPNAPSR